MAEDQSEEKPMSQPGEQAGAKKDEKHFPVDSHAPISATIQQEPENMEVHHHAHSHGKKNWKTYFWEFLMLFLAVFCGFLAEYQLEHKIEKQRAKEYALSLYRDIIADTVAYSRSIRNLNICTANIDSLIVLLGNKDEAVKNTNRIHKLSIYAFVFPVNQPNESTIQQLLNSGSLRYFRSSGLIDSVKVYNNAIQIFKEFREDIGALNIEFRKAQLRVIEVNPLIETISQGNFSIPEILNLESTAITDNTQLLTNDQALLKEYANWCALKKFYMTNTASNLSRLKNQAEAVLLTLKDEYHFK